MGNCLGCTEKKKPLSNLNNQQPQIKNQSNLQNHPFQNIYQNNQQPNNKQSPQGNNAQQGKQKRTLNSNLNKLQKFFISEHQTLLVTDFRAMYKIYTNTENALLQKDNKSSNQQVMQQNSQEYVSVIVLDKRLGFNVNEYSEMLNSKDGLKLGQAQYSILKDQTDITLLKVQYEKTSTKNLAQTIAENSTEAKDLQRLYKAVILNLLQFLEYNKDKNIKFNFNPEQIIVFKDEHLDDIELQPQILFEMDQQTLEQNECLRVRWNITIDKKYEDQISQPANEASNKLSIAMLAYWLEDDGYVRGSLKDKYFDIITNQEKLQEYIKSIDIDYRGQTIANCVY